MSKRIVVVLVAALAACSPRPSTDPALLSPSDSLAILTRAIEFATDSLAYFRPYDRVWLARESVVRDSVVDSFSPDIAASLEASVDGLRVRDRETEFVVCPASGPRFAGDCDLREDGLMLTFEGLRTSRDSLGVAVTLGVSEPRGRGAEGWYAIGYFLQFGWQRGEWVVRDLSVAWEV